MNGKAINDIDPKTLDDPTIPLLGAGQEQFLREWAADWRDTDMKMAASDTIFACLQAMEPLGIYADADTNGWPRSGRNRAIAELR